ncbi:ABC transporter ATP-binding protein [Streptomyces tailanensis]|uniref:ABC transporter ATP-binding protein n=1 Tax=Streptomyces tailanensis TaxID=2569858 RepID=UPI00122E2264|nr:ATP-binding cassette domain-containing protein [Streptomyces tailanensis]
MAEFLVARGLRKEFGGKRAVDGVSISLKPGVVTGFLGANGAGKTTAIRLMLGLVSGEGEAVFFGRPLEYWRNPSGMVGAVLGGVAGHPRHRVRRHLRMVAAGAGVPDSRVDEVLEQVGLTEAGAKRLSELSLGLSQRVGIAQALLADPPVLILDEPANGLDPHSIRWLRDLLLALAREGRAVLVSSHQLAELEQLVDRVIVLAQGKVVAEATTAELAARAHGRVTVEGPHVEKLADPLRELGAAYEATGPGCAVVTGATRFQVGDMAAEHGVTLHWLHEQPPSLEDFYLSVAEEEFRIS